MMDTSTTQSRLDELEAKFALVDDLVDTLNHTIYRQQQQIDQLTKALSELASELRAHAPPSARNLRDEVPPHY